MVSSKPCKRPKEIPIQKWFADDVVCSLSRELQIRVGENGIATGKGRSSEEKQKAGQKPIVRSGSGPIPKAFPILLADLERGVTATHKSGCFPVDNLLPSTSAIATAQL
jgi:hypothetical protein